MDWIEGLNRTLRYIEEHLTDAELNVESAAQHCRVLAVLSATDLFRG